MPYVILIVVLGLVSGGGWFYYNDTQNTIATLRENNAQLKVAVDTAEESINTLQSDITKMADLNNQMQNRLQQAEAYSDELRGKFSRLDLVQDALKDSNKLEGKMNGATAKLWRGFMADTGNTNQYDKPSWLQRPEEQARAGDQSSNEDPKDDSTSSSETETTPAN